MERQRQAARRFFEVIPPLLHSLGSVIRELGDASGPVTIQQFRAMSALRHRECSLGELAEMHEVSAPAASRLVSTLVERGWVQREIDPSDRRQIVLSLTGSGAQILHEVSQRSTEHLASILLELNADEFAVVERSLEALGRVTLERRAARCAQRPEMALIGGDGSASNMKGEEQ